MAKGIEACYNGDISSQLQKLVEVGSFETVNNSDCSLLQPIESVKQMPQKQT